MRILSLYTTLLILLSLKIHGQGDPCDNSVPPVEFIVEINGGANLSPGDQFSINIRANNFTNVSVAQLVLGVNPNLIEIDPSCGVNNPMAGPQVISGVSADLFLLGPLRPDPDALEDGIINLLFFADTGPSVTIDEGAIFATFCFKIKDFPTQTCSDFNLVSGGLLDQFIQIGDFPNNCMQEVLIFNPTNTQIKVGCENPMVTNLRVCNSTGSMYWETCGNNYPMDYTITFPDGSTMLTNTLEDENQSFNANSNLPSGIYLITLTDSLGNTNGLGTQVNIDRNLPDMDLETTFREPLCADLNNGEISFSISGGKPDYQVQFSNGTYMSGSEGTLQFLENGTYNLTVTDSDGCTVESADIIFDIPAIEVTYVVDDFDCLYSPDGAITVTVAGGTPDSNGEYEINGEIGSTITFDDPMNNTFDFEKQDTCYTVFVRDDLECPVVVCIPIPIVDPPQIRFDTVPPDCDNPGYSASVILESIPQDASYVSRLRKLGQIDIVNHASGPDCAFIGRPVCGVPNGTNSYLSPGEYIWTIDILSGGTFDVICREVITFEIPDFVSNPIFTIENLTQPTCGGDDGEIFLITRGGEEPYSYIWEDAPTISINELSGLSAGTYNVTIVDNEGCEKDTFVNLLDGEYLITEITQVRALRCSDPTAEGILQLTTEGIPQDELIFNWYTDTESDLGSEAQFMTTEPGIYFVDISNASGTCQSTEMIELEDPGALSWNVDFQNPATCDPSNPRFGYIEILTLAGGTAPYFCDWSLNGFPLPGQSSCRRENLDVGTYTITIRDSAGCIDDQEITLISDDDIEVAITITPPTCPDSENGQIAIGDATGPTLSCQWERSDIDVSNCIATNLAAGEYNVTVLDDAGCSTDTTIVLSAQDLFSAEIISISGISCTGIEDGEVTVTVDDPNQGTMFSYQWSNQIDNQGGITDTNSSLPTGPGNVIVIDQVTTCSQELTFDIPDANTFSITSGTNLDAVSCADDCDGEVNLQIENTGQTAGTYEVMWEDGMETTARTGLCPDVYPITVTDGNGCSIVDSVYINEPLPLSLNVDEVRNISCDDVNGGAISINVEGGCGSFSYLWSDGITSDASASNLSEGQYSVTVSDACGCTITTTQVVEGVSLVQAEIEIVEEAQCAGDLVCVGINQSTITGGSGIGYTFELGLSERIPIDSCLRVSPGDHHIVVYDSGRCSDSIGFVTIPGPTLLQVDLGPDITVSLGDDPIDIIADIADNRQISTVTWIQEDSTRCISDDPCLGIMTAPSVNSVVTVLVTDENGCTATDDVNLFVTTNRRVYTPTIFDPNSRIDDRFMILTGEGVTRIEDFVIYDRWGNSVFELDDNLKDFPHSKDDGWDGRKNNRFCEPGVYVWIAYVRFVDNEVIKYQGQVTMIR